jgi:hypothetical protein
MITSPASIFKIHSPRNPQYFLKNTSECVLQVVKTLLSCLDDPQLPLLQWQECMAVLATRLPKDMRAQVASLTQHRSHLKSSDRHKHEGSIFTLVTQISL